jgi:hypothetical protein
MLGFMAGNDYLRGSATVLSTSGKPVYTFEVSVSYALGGYMKNSLGILPMSSVSRGGRQIQKDRMLM